MKINEAKRSSLVPIAIGILVTGVYPARRDIKTKVIIKKKKMRSHHCVALKLQKSLNPLRVGSEGASEPLKTIVFKYN